MKQVVLAGFLLSVLQVSAQYKLVPQQVPVTSSLRGISVVNEQVAWVSGSAGTVLRTIDGGETWENKRIKEAIGVEFRDIEAFDSLRAVALSAGSPGMVYSTHDGGSSWERTYLNTHPEFFLDAMSFWNEQHGIAFGDAINGHLMLLTTRNGGQSWQLADTTHLPPSPKGEGGFAASGTCLTTFGDSTVWIGLGSPNARIFKSVNQGQTWQVFKSGMQQPTPTGGIFSLAFSSKNYGLAVGGNYEDKTNTYRNAAFTTDGGQTWQLLTEQPPGGYRSVVVTIPGTQCWLAAGRSGIDISLDNGLHWQSISNDNYQTAAFANENIGWVCGNGKIAKLIKTSTK